MANVFRPVACAAILALLFSSSVALAANYYVAKNGNDVTGDGSVGNPWTTLHYGLSALKPGDSLVVRAGTYAEGLNDIWPAGTSWAMPIRLMASPGEEVVIKPVNEVTAVWIGAGDQYVIMDGLIVDGADLLPNADVLNIRDGAHHIRLQNCEIRNAGRMGIFVIPDAYAAEIVNCSIHDSGIDHPCSHGIDIRTHDNLVDRCVLYRNGAWGALVYSNRSVDPNTAANTVRGCASYDNARIKLGAAGIGLFSGPGLVAYNNMVWGNTDGFQVGLGAVGAKVFNNTSCGNKWDGINIGPESSGTEVRNNVVCNNGNYGIGVYSQCEDGTRPAATWIISNNVAYNNAVGGLGDQDGGIAQHYCSVTLNGNKWDADPLFVDPSISNYRLRAGSPCIDAADGAAAPTQDFYGDGRHDDTGMTNLGLRTPDYADIGACEFQGNTPFLAVATSVPQTYIPLPAITSKPVLVARVQPTPTTLLAPVPVAEVQPPTPPQNAPGIDFVIDNSDNPANRAFSVLSGSWSLSADGSGKYGPSAVQAKTTAGANTALARWSTTALPFGRYAVYAWWQPGAGHSHSVAYSIKSGSVILATVRVDQSTNGGQWNYLGTYTFKSGARAVELDNGHSQGSAVEASLSADAVGFTRVGS